MFSRVVWPRTDLVETSSSSCLLICRRAFGVAVVVLAVYENEIQAICFFVLVSSPRIVATLHITFSWLPLPIGQVCSQVWCRPHLAAHFGFFDLRTFPWSLSQVQVSTFYPFTPKVGSKCTYIILTISSVNPSTLKTDKTFPTLKTVIGKLLFQIFFCPHENEKTSREVGLTHL